MSNSLGPSIVAVWKADDALKVIDGPWLTMVKIGTAYPNAAYVVRPGRTVPSFGGDTENQYQVEFSIYTPDEVAARGYLAAMDARFHMTKFEMTAPETCMSSFHERPGEVSFSGVGKGNVRIYRARCVYLVRVFTPAS